MNNRNGYFFLALVALAVAFALTSGGSSASSASNESSAPAGKPEAISYSPSNASTGKSREVKAEDITLSKSNTLVFRAVVTPLSVAAAQKQLLDLDDGLAAGKPIYIVLDTPGGDIIAGNLLIDTAKGLKRPVHTITTFAASMGFNMVQRLGTRYITPSGQLMAHRASVSGVGGQVPCEFLTAVGLIYSQVTKMEKQNAARLGISFEDYTALVQNEYWVIGEDAVKQNAADKLANIQCDKSLSGTNTTRMATIFGPVDVTFANCPAISAPINIQFGGKEPEDAELYLGNYNLLRKALLGENRF